MGEAELIDLSLIELIREKDLVYLTNSTILESELLLELGLNNQVLNEFPEELYEFCGLGLLHWQYPNQFSKYLVQISKFKIESYLEIGVRHGGTFIITVEYLERFHSLKYAIGIDINMCPSLNEYKKINSKINFMMMDSQSDKFLEFMKERKFDLVLIDGSHDEIDCENDFKVIKNNAKIIVFHDISNDVCPDVGKVWNNVKEIYADEYIFFEYTDQYKSVFERTKKSFLGIGMAVKKGYLE